MTPGRSVINGGTMSGEGGGDCFLCSQMLFIGACMKIPVGGLEVREGRKI